MLKHYGVSVTPGHQGRRIPWLPFAALAACGLRGMCRALPRDDKSYQVDAPWTLMGRCVPCTPRRMRSHSGSCIPCMRPHVPSPMQLPCARRVVRSDRIVLGDAEREALCLAAAVRESGLTLEAFTAAMDVRVPGRQLRTQPPHGCA
jgi:hypothetical protein